MCAVHDLLKCLLVPKEVEAEAMFLAKNAVFIFVEEKTYGVA